MKPAVHNRITEDALGKHYGKGVTSLLRKGSDLNDFGDDLAGLIQTHFANSRQPVHALRRRNYTGPDADQLAVRDIRNQITRFLLDARQAHESGKTNDAIVLAGRALHTVQDSYVHCERRWDTQSSRGKIFHVQTFMRDHRDRLDQTGRKEATRTTQEFMEMFRGVLTARSQADAQARVNQFLDQKVALVDYSKGHGLLAEINRVAQQAEREEAQRAAQRKRHEDLQALSRSLLSRPSTSDSGGSGLTSRSYTFQRGQTVWGIAKENGFDDPREFVKAFQRLNPNVNPNKVYASRTYSVPFRTPNLPLHDPLPPGVSTLPKWSVGTERGPMSHAGGVAQTLTGYTFQRGETVLGKAAQFGFDDRREFLKAFRAHNPGVDPNKVYAGKTYVMPTKIAVGGQASGTGQPLPPLGSLRPSASDRLAYAKGSVSHTFQRGETVWGKAASYGYDDHRQFVRDFAKLNPGVDPNKVFAGRAYKMPTRAPMSIVPGLAARPAPGWNLGPLRRF